MLVGLGRFLFRVEQVMDMYFSDKYTNFETLAHDEIRKNIWS